MMESPSLTLFYLEDPLNQLLIIMFIDATKNSLKRYWCLNYIKEYPLGSSILSLLLYDGLGRHINYYIQ